jgi:hypothetical protein
MEKFMWCSELLAEAVPGVYPYPFLKLPLRYAQIRDFSPGTFYRIVEKLSIGDVNLSSIAACTGYSFMEIDPVPPGYFSARPYGGGLSGGATSQGRGGPRCGFCAGKTSGRGSPRKRGACFEIRRRAAGFLYYMVDVGFSPAVLGCRLPRRNPSTRWM